MWNQFRLCTLSLAWIACVQHSVVSTVSPCSGGVALLGTEYTIQADRSSYAGFVWIRPSDGRYVVTCYPSCSPVAGYSAAMNTTHTTLTINSVTMEDAGTWSIVDAITVDAVPVQVCQLTVAKLPRCNISSDTDPATLQPSTTLTLTVNIRGYYCSQEAGLNLTTGDVAEMLMKQNVTDVSDVVTSSTFSVTPARLGNVTVSFMCDVNRWELNCDGVNSLGVASAVSPCSGGVALLGTEYTIQADRSSYTAFVWARPSDGLYVAICIPWCSTVSGYGAVVNSTHATLTIDSVKMLDAGTWSISDANVADAIHVQVCELTVET